MNFDEAVKGLRSEEIEALKVLEASGWQVGLDVRVEDMTKPDGTRRRTFSNRGRYAVAVFLKNLGGRDRVEFPAFTPDLAVQGIEPVKESPTRMEVVEAVAEAVAEAEVKPIEAKADPVPAEKPAKVFKRKGGARR
jgi:uncharacterized protein (DUF362 family)